MIQLLIIPGELPTMNDIIEAAKGRGYSKGQIVPGAAYAAWKKTHTDKVWALAKAAKLRPVTRPVRLHFLWVRKDKRTDPGNIRAAEKYVGDGLERAGVLPRDSWQWVVSFTDHFAICRDSPRTEVIIEEVDQ